MLNLLIAVAAAIAALLGSYLALGHHWWSAVLPGTVALLGVYVWLARRATRQLETLFMSAQKELLARRTDKALALLDSGFALARWQFFVAPQIHAQKGVLLYVLERDDEAEPHLRQAFFKHWVARAMLGSLCFRRKQFAQMEPIFEAAVRAAKKEPLLWAVYAWCLDKSGARPKAIEVLGRGVELNPADERLKKLQIALQNDKRMKMHAWGNEWFQFRLERPPLEYTGGRRVQFERR